MASLKLMGLVRGGLIVFPPEKSTSAMKDPAAAVQPQLICVLPLVSALRSTSTSDVSFCPLDHPPSHAAPSSASAINNLFRCVVIDVTLVTSAQPWECDKMSHIRKLRSR
jgi:hypothetical protein